MAALEYRLDKLEAQIRARLKEEAEARQVLEDNIGGYMAGKDGGQD